MHKHDDVLQDLLITFNTRLKSVMDSWVLEDTLKKPIVEVLSWKGKRTRPLLAMLSCAVCCGDPFAALHSSIAIEILHNFTLVHDDIMDRAPLRRGMQTIHIVHGEPLAILAGDAMVALAYQLMLRDTVDVERKSRILEVFTRGYLDVCEGQALDIATSDDPTISLHQYLKMIELKTAKLLEMSVGIGAIAAGADQTAVDALASFARHIGIGFQINDDVLDLMASQSEMGKAVGNDLVEGKKTYLVLKALELATEPEDREWLQFYLRSGGIEKNQVEHFKNLFERLGVTTAAQNDCRRQHDFAKLSLNKLPASHWRETLDYFSDQLAQRKF